MEFFRIVEVVTDEEEIKSRLKLDNVVVMTNLLFQMDSFQEHEAPIRSLWGEFTLSRQSINGGLRFSLVECPNALTWTVTTGYEPSKGSIVIHLTINRKQNQQEFVEEIEEFLDDQAKCLQQTFAKELRN